MRKAPWIGLSVAIVLMLAAMIIPAATGWNVYVRWSPPLHADWMPRLGPGTVPAIVIAVLAALYAIRFARDWPWRRMLLLAYLAGLAWLLSLATVDGVDGIAHILTTNYEYLNTANAVTDFPATLREYISRIPYDHPDNWPVHIAGHPPGALLFFVVLVQLGLGSGLAAGLVVVVLAATIPVAVMLTVRRLGSEHGARLAAPFLVFGSSAIWMAVSADAMFGAFAAWGLCALAYSATAKGTRGTAAWGLLAGLLLGYCVMLSYGLPLLGVLAVAVLLIARNWRPLLWALITSIAVVLSFAAYGFAWWEAYPVLAQRYWDGIATRRPLGYWIWGNFAALAFSAGPIVGASVAMAISKIRMLRPSARPTLEPERRGEDFRPIIVLTLAALLSVVLADLSGMSKAEVERIWLPFVPWLLLGTALLPELWRRYGLILQLVFALVVQHLLFTGW